MLLLWIPAAVFAAVGATLSTVAYRFLRPPTQGINSDAGGGEEWTAVARVPGDTGGEPLLRKVVVERRAGWSLEREERAVYVLPGERVVSAVCPHEQCEVAWVAEARQFQCPCHDSRFTPEGERLGGPAVSGLEQLPARVENGVLQIYFPDTRDSA